MLAVKGNEVGECVLLIFALDFRWNILERNYVSCGKWVHTNKHTYTTIHAHTHTYTRVQMYPIEKKKKKKTGNAISFIVIDHSSRNSVKLASQAKELGRERERKKESYRWYSLLSRTTFPWAMLNYERLHRPLVGLRIKNKMPSALRRTMSFISDTHFKWNLFPCAISWNFFSPKWRFRKKK